MASSPVQFTVSGITARLFQLIQNMPEEKKRELIFFIGDQRKHPRKQYIMSIEYEIQEGRFKDFILDISQGGVYLESQNNFFIGQEIRLFLSFKGEAEPFAITGSVVWSDANGIGVKFIFQNTEQREKLAAFIEKL